MQHAEAAAIVVDAVTGPVLADIVAHLSGVCQRISLAATPAVGEIAWSDVLAEPSTSAPMVEVDANQVASLIYTSGTTGQPKGVMQPHRSYVIAGESFAMRASLRADDRVLTVLPLFHANAQFYSTMGTLVSGATLILLRRFSASQFWEHVQHYDATQFNFIGAMARMLYNQPPTPFEATHRVRIACGAPLPVEIYDNFGFCRKVRFWGKIQKSGVKNSMTYRLPNSRKSNFATEPSWTRSTPMTVLPRLRQSGPSTIRHTGGGWKRCRRRTSPT